MKAILDEHAEQLTPRERVAIWETIAGVRSRPRAAASWTHRAMAIAGVAAVAIAVFVIAVPRHLPPRHGRFVPGAEFAPSREMAGAAPAPSREMAGAAPATPSVIPHATPRHATRGFRAPSDADVRRWVAEADAAHRLPTAVSPGGGLVVTLPRPTSAAGAPTRPGPPGTVTGRITDMRGQPIAFANVVIPEARAGAMTAPDGTYRIDRVSAGMYTLAVQFIGYKKATRSGLLVDRTHGAAVDLQLEELPIAMQEMTVLAPRSVVDTKHLSTSQLQSLRVDNRSQAIAQRAGIATDKDLRIHGGRTGDVKFQVNGVARVAQPLPPVVPTTGGSRLPNDEAYDSMFFKNYGVNPFIAAEEDPFSTFATDVDAASYTITRRYLELGSLPPADAVRVEEFVNFFPQDYPPAGDDDFRIAIDGAPSPFGEGYQLLRIGIEARKVIERERKPAQLTFVIDVSGSMDRENRLELVKRALHLLVDRLRADDAIGIVVFGTQGRVLLEPTAIGNGNTRADLDPRADEVAGRWSKGRERILDAIDRLHPEGSTNTEDGLRLGYEMARRHYRGAANNRIVLCSDGVANEGHTGPESILAEVRTGADGGIALSTIGFGMGNYNDVLMEQLADRGDGDHYYVDDIDEARRVFVENLIGTLQTIAKDAKVQVEFDSTRVVRYRLLGFENRDVADRDFRNDKVDAGEIGAGHEVTALYEVKLAPHVTNGTLATVRLRYARPEAAAGAARVREIEQRFTAGALSPTFEAAAPRFRLDAAVAEFAEILRGSYWAKDGKLADVLAVARGAARELHDDATRELIRLVEQAAKLQKRAGAGAHERER